MIYDLVIIGLGAMGSSSLYHASTQYNNILAIEQFEPTHNKGSSHGETRIIREAYYEGEFYVPMAQKSLELFLKLQEESKQQLYQKTGCLIVGKEKSKLIRQSYQSAVKHNVSFKIYKTNQELQQKVPGFTLPKGFVGLFDETAGILYPEKFLSPCSGHGFKFSSLIGNMACEILEKQVNKYDMFKIQRLQEIKPNL
ncbi:sarcosine oxidase, putative [Ichthyophthirius multifiliis]|uniref:Sarcosine oxidase, putative n=1 Tax=Ichthyophthirius multifiliis TaxID=5932 RepID=G0QV37_ICHMU|nr:sarcosine oxidase, putative [Ichthyophthirius multifiliis]EGR30911.1 sarcosine oxidase, putative [Ichthyophthirius multifiliis]|eukprot:XP_004032498.1 sarcosine oxidase, putative [Ichthyophthirius multifiliis]